MNKVFLVVVGLVFMSCSKTVTTTKTTPSDYRPSGGGNNLSTYGSFKGQIRCPINSIQYFTENSGEIETGNCCVPISMSYGLWAFNGAFFSCLYSSVEMISNTLIEFSINEDEDVSKVSLKIKDGRKGCLPLPDFVGGKRQNDLRKKEWVIVKGRHSFNSSETVRPDNEFNYLGGSINFTDSNAEFDFSISSGVEELKRP